MALPMRPACENREPGALHDCGAPAIWAGRYRSGRVLHFCDACHCCGHLAAEMHRWEPLRYGVEPPPPGGLFDDGERAQIDWIRDN